MLAFSFLTCEIYFWHLTNLNIIIYGPPTRYSLLFRITEITGFAEIHNYIIFFRVIQRHSFDPERLSNRGGCLLKDEKERKRLTAELNKVSTPLYRIADSLALTMYIVQPK